MSGATGLDPDLPVFDLGPLTLRAPAVRPRQGAGHQGHLWQWVGDGDPLLTLTVAARRTRLMIDTAAEGTLGTEIDRTRSSFDDGTEVRVRRVRDLSVDGAVHAAAATVTGVRDGLPVRNGLLVTTDGTLLHLVRIAVVDGDEGVALIGHVLDDVHVHQGWTLPE